MEKAVFLNYFEKSFLKITSPSPENPILLIYDGHSSYVDLSLMEMAFKNNVTILLLPPHFSHLLQPMDLAVFKSVKSTWDQRLCNWSRHHQGQKLPKAEPSKLICEIWADMNIQIIKNGLKKAYITLIKFRKILDITFAADNFFHARRIFVQKSTWSMYHVSLYYLVQ